LNLKQLEGKDENSSAWDGSTCATVSIPKLAWDVKLPFGTLVHELEGFRPPLDDLIRSKCEGLWMRMKEQAANCEGRMLYTKDKTTTTPSIDLPLLACNWNQTLFHQSRYLHNGTCIEERIVMSDVIQKSINTMHSSTTV
jgi:hypothetical protein